jgi:hypothetical protein
MMYLAVWFALSIILAPWIGAFLAVGGSTS